MWRKIFTTTAMITTSAICAAIIVGALHSSASPPVEPVCGDANNDGILGLEDPLIVLQHLFLGGPAPVCAEGSEPYSGWPPRPEDMVELGGVWELGDDLVSAPAGELAVVYTVPIGKTLVVTRAVMDDGTNSQCAFAGDTGNGPVPRLQYLYTQIDDTRIGYSNAGPVGLVFPEGSDVGFAGLNGNGVSIARYHILGYLVDCP